ncbi:crotonyl-CoA carboxylase/reductase [Streptomyces sp. LARHCF249]
MDEIISALLSEDAAPGDFQHLRLPESYRGNVVRKEDTGMFEGMATADKDPRKSLHLQDVPTPEPGPGEALIAVMASAVNYNTVWSSIFEPLATFGFLERYGRLSELTRRHDLPYHVLGSDLCGVVLRTGPGVNRWQPGDRVVAHCLSVELESAEGHNDTMLDPEQRIWGFETNFGGLAELALVKSNQLMPKPEHLTWEEAASPGLVNSTAYRQLVSRNGAGMKQGDNVLIWGASGGLGSYATQLALAGGANPVCVVSSPQKAEICRRMGATAIIDRNAEGYRFWKDEDTQDPREWKRFGKRIRELTGGEDVDIVFEHPGRETFGASVYVARKGGTIVTCASTSGYRHEFDNRYLWMSLKRIVGSHFANYREAWEANRLIAKGKIHPTLSKVHSLEDTGQAAYEVHQNLHHGKVGVLALAPREGLGVRNHELRATHLDAINRFRTDLGTDTGTGIGTGPEEAGQ